MLERLTIIAGFVFFFVCPDSPATAHFLSPLERRVAIERVRVNQSSLGSKTIKWTQVREALNPLEDPQGWLLFCATFCLTTPNGGVGTFVCI